MASPPEKRNRRAWAHLQDVAESMSEAELRAVIDSLVLPSCRRLWVAFTRALRGQITDNNMRRRIYGTEAENPEEDLSDDGDDDTGDQLPPLAAGQ